MAWHNTPCINFHTFLIYTVIQIFNYAIKLNTPHKNIYTKYSGKTYKYKPL